MNFNLDITEFEKFPQGFYFDFNLAEEKNCSLKIIDRNFRSELTLEVSLVEEEENDEMDEDMTQAETGSIIATDKYDCFCCLKNYCPIKKIFTHEFHFSFFVDRELNTYYVVNDFENCSDEYPVDDTYCQELDIFPEILKLLFMNPPTYIGYRM